MVPLLEPSGVQRPLLWMVLPLSLQVLLELPQQQRLKKVRGELRGGKPPL